ncbi:MAG TPA: NAD(P)/FAD-dependent oxidoreductase [bacterium]|nr:NAD(P)/FAD-dependent oxidoreductase [bacterium]
MESKRVLIIGAGIAGLSAGCYLRMNGYGTHIIELHDKPGGLCTSWKRQGYTVDGCIHWLVGTAPSSPFHRIWRELGALQGREIVYYDEFARYELPDGRTIHFRVNPDELAAGLKEIAPEDSKAIDELAATIRKMAALEQRDDDILVPPELRGFFSKIGGFFRMLPLLRALGPLFKLDQQSYAERFTNPELRASLTAIIPKAITALALPMTLAGMHARNTGYPVGGSLEFARAIEKRYTDLGGEIAYDSRVAEILVEDDTAVGVRLEDGTEHRADYVVSAADGHSTFFKLLGGKYVSDEQRRYFEEIPIFDPLVFVAFGVKRVFDELPPLTSGVIFHPSRPLEVADRTFEHLTVVVENFDPTLAPAGSTVVKVMFGSDYEWWKAKAADREAYLEAKEEIARQVLEHVEERFPGIGSQVEMTDVATPLTFERYTANWQGGMEGWMMTPGTLRLRMKRTVPGLKNFRMIGQWVSPGGGLPPAGSDGRHLAMILCKRDGVKFHAEEA